MKTVQQHTRQIRHKAAVAHSWLKNHVISTAIFSLCLVALLGGVLFVTIYYRDKAAPDTTIANANVGGQNIDQIKNTINGLIKNMRLSLTYGGKSKTASSTDLGVSIDVDEFAKKAVATGKNNIFSVLFAHQHFDLTGTYDQNKVKQFVTTAFPELTTNPIDAQVVYDKNQNQFTVKSGAIGKSIEIKGLYEQIEKLLSSPKLTNYEIATINSRPAVNDDSAKKTADTMNSTLAQSIQIVNNGKVIWTIDPWTIADWTKFTIENNSYAVSYDKDKIRNFVNTDVAGQLSGKPINQKAVTNSQGEVLRVISEGKNGQVPENIDSVVNQIYDHLESSKGGQINLATKDAGFSTDATVAKDGHWIEYNLSTFTVTLYDGANAVWSTNQTSTGKESTPTISGLYTVWHKVYNQCMPNPPSPDPLCNIHYVTYWEKSGYAFHEAWWMNYSNGNVRSRISHGCVNMFQADAKRVYEWASIGTPVWVHW